MTVITKELQATATKSSLDYYLDLVENTESPLLYHRWSFISAISAAIGRNTWLPFGEKVIYPNQFIVLVGPPGARKSGALETAAKVLRQSGYEHFAGDSSSREKFLADWEFGFDKINRGIEPTSKNQNNDEDDLEQLFGGGNGNNKSTKVSEAYIASTELQDFIGSGGGGLVPTLTNLWDNQPYYTDRFKNSKSLYISNPTINLLGGATVTSFATMFSATIVGQGMLSRMILVYGKGQRKRITIPPPFSPELTMQLTELLMVIRRDIIGPMTITTEAYHILDAIYKNYHEIGDSRLASYSSRRFTHLLKLCIVIAASELVTTITPDIVVYANTILSYTELYMPKALGEFGKSKSSEVSQIVLEAISNVGEFGIDLSELMTIVSQDVNTIHELTGLVMKLKEAGKINVVLKNGAPAFVPVVKKVSDKSLYVAYDLLPEYRNGENE